MNTPRLETKTFRCFLTQKSDSQRRKGTPKRQPRGKQHKLTRPA